MASFHGAKSMKHVVVSLVAIMVLAFVGMTMPQTADARGKGGHYAGGKGSSHKGGSYVPPPGKRYSR